MDNPYEAPATSDHPDAAKTWPRGFLFVLVSSFHGTSSAIFYEWIWYGLFGYGNVWAMYFYGVGFLWMLLLLWNCRKRRLLYDGLFWTIQCISFLTTMHFVSEGSRPHVRAIANCILVPWMGSEAMFRVVDWFRRHWSKPPPRRKYTSNQRSK